MNIYNLGDDVFVEVVEEPEMLENRNAYKVKVYRHTYPQPPIFKYNQEVFLEVPCVLWASRSEATELEFSEAINKKLGDSWKAMFEIEKSSGGGVFTLSPLAVATRDAYKKTHGLDHIGFLQVLHKLKEEWSK